MYLHSASVNNGVSSEKDRSVRGMGQQIRIEEGNAEGYILVVEMCPKIFFFKITEQVLLCVFDNQKQVL